MLGVSKQGHSPRDSPTQFRCSSTYEFKLNQGLGDTAARCGEEKKYTMKEQLLEDQAVELGLREE